MLSLFFVTWWDLKNNLLLSGQVVKFVIVANLLFPLKEANTCLFLTSLALGCIQSTREFGQHAKPLLADLVFLPALISLCHKKSGEKESKKGTEPKPDPVPLSST